RGGPASPAGLAPGEGAIEPLAEPEARELAHRLLSEDEGGAAFPQGREEVIARESRGSPFFVQELVQYFRAAGTQTVQAALADSALLDEGLWQRIQTRPEPARRLVRLDAACKAGDLTDQAVPTSLRTARLLRSTGAEEFVETYHDRVRETVLAHLDPRARERHHRRLAEVLEEGGRTEPEM